MSIQDTFNRVIDAGYYGIDQATRDCSPYMCHALAHAEDDFVITRIEAYQARRAIEKELDKTGSLTMHTHLFRMAREYYHQAPTNKYRDKDFTALYRDWDNRPKPVEVHLHATFN